MKQLLSMTMRVILLLTLLLSSCKDLETLPQDRYAANTFWQSANAANAALVGCYSTLILKGLYGDGSMLAGEAISPNAYDYSNIDGWNNISLGTHNATNTAAIANRWTAAYTGIGRCNTFLEGIDLSTEVSADKKTKMKAEARFLRALFYHVLITHYNGVPFITSAPAINQKDLPRTPRAEIVKFIINELNEIAPILPATYTVNTDKGRATSGAALSLKARVLLYEASPLFAGAKDMAKWKNAADAAKAVIDLNRYSLFSNYRALFGLANEYSSESIFDVQFQGPNAGSSMDIILRQYNYCAPVKNLIDSYIMKDGLPRSSSGVVDPANFYNNMDPRFYQTVVYPGSTFMGKVVTNTQYAQTGYTFKKYTVYDVATPSAEDAALKQLQSSINYMLIRYADILLMYAEAKNELGEMTPDVWNSTIKLIRQRAGFTDAGALNYPLNPASITETIKYERRMEFAGEGIYYNDVRRWKTAETEMNTTIKKYNDTPIITRKFNAARDYWWPIPGVEIEQNPALTQNPGGY